MHKHCWLALLLLVWCLHPASAADVPPFTPNVVDPDGYLGDAEREAVNQALQRIRDTQQVWGAVYIVDTLKGEPIEHVAVEAFEQWQLGQQGLDNGLLLVLAMSDRRSRFEVGYGLEGSITDIAALHALDDYLAPKMRAGDTAGAIIDAFDFLSRIAAQDPATVEALAQAAIMPGGRWRRGFIAWGALLFGIWFAIPIRNLWVRRQRARLQALDPTLSFDDEHIIKTPGRAKPWKGNVLVQGFLSINPGIFVVILSAEFLAGFLISIGGTVLILFLLVYFSGRRYGSLERYQRFLDSLARQRERLIRKGHLEEKTPGTYAYTPAYHASRRASSSSRSSSFSSSSGGGRSGGGGASSGW